jgi:sugar lactone lactonase YvrE
VRGGRVRLCLAAALASLAIVSVASASSAGSGLSGGDVITIIGGSSLRGSGHWGYAGDGGPATKAQFKDNVAVAVDANGNVYIADSGNHVVRKIDACGTISTFAGTGKEGFSGDGGPAAKAQLDNPHGVVVDAHGNVLISDFWNNRTRKVTPDGTITTAWAPTNWFRAAIGPDGSLYGNSGHGVVRVSPSGQLSEVAGVVAGRTPVPAGTDGVPALGESIGPAGPVVFDTHGDLFFAESIGAHWSVVRKIDTAGKIWTVAGSYKLILPTPGLPPVGRPATAVNLAEINGMAVDRDGNLYLAEKNVGRVDRVSGGRIYPVAGDTSLLKAYGPPPLGAGGPAAKARFGDVTDIALDPQGNLVVDDYHGRIWKIWHSPAAAAPKLSLHDPAAATLAGGSLSFTLTCDKACLVAGDASTSVGGRTVSLGHAAVSQSGTLCPATLTIRIPQPALAQLRTALEPGATASVRVALTAADSSGKHKTRLSRTVALHR